MKDKTVRVAAYVLISAGILLIALGTKGLDLWNCSFC
ncbi:hypothetical protein LCGC14_0401350 [marine sediment metagenome]|uniref:Uncharacterized protein n=1 Tax=marine sediment metagenome TaxID=412755 RepID=A0A0F9TF14_9ZZZZ